MRALSQKRVRFQFRNLQFAICIAAYLAILLILTGPTTAWGAVGCDLNDPDRDVARLFPESTGYKTIYTSVSQKGGEKLLAKIETRLGDKFHGLYETIDVPYTVYEIFAGKKKNVVSGNRSWRSFRSIAS